jgi:hypothetical protein
MAGAWKRGNQFLLAGAMLAAVILTFGTLAFLGRTTPVIPDYVQESLDRQRATNGLYYFDNGYMDEGDFVLLGQLPRDDYSRGGVYFIGASELNTGLMVSRLTPAERQLIHNYSLGDIRHTDVRQYVRMLVEEFDLLKAGGEKTTVILGLTHQLARRKESAYADGLFARHGLYSYEWGGTIARRPMPAIAVEYVLLKDLARRYLHLALDPPNRVRETPDTPEVMHNHMTGVMTGDWKTLMEAEVQELFATIDYLQERDVHVQAVLPPRGSWQKKYPYADAYLDIVLPILAERNVPVTDFGNLAADDEFMDALHVRYSGQVKFHAGLHALAREALARMGTHLVDPLPRDVRGDTLSRQETDGAS